MSVFRDNVLRHNKINVELEPHGLLLTGDSIFDKTLPEYMHSFVCRVDQRSDMFAETPLSHPVIAAYLADGRKDRINAFLAEQAEARAWSNREMNQ